MVKEMMGMSPLFAQFMAEKGLPFILDNMEGKGIDDLKDLVKEWTEEYKRIKNLLQQISDLQREILRRHATEKRLKRGRP